MFTAEQLLQPVSAAQPAGADLAFSPEMDAIAHARKFDDPSLDQGEWVTQLKEADWDFVVQRCAALLAGASKDLRLGVWLAEAAAKRHHLAGLAEGLRVTAGLVEHFWDQGLYPEAEDGDQEQRIGNLAWLLARIPALLKEIPVTDGNGSAWTLLDFEVARKANLDDGRPLAEMEAARRNSSAAFREAFAADAQSCMDALLGLERAVDARLGNDAPAFVAARDAIASLLGLMPAAPTVATASMETTEHGAMPIALRNDAPATVIHAGPPGAITSRAQALTQLRAIAEFFRRTEPHSPVSYFADKAANAGEQDLHTWLRSVVKDSSSLAHIEELLGVQPRQD
ncbi:type VI secretion system protein TssA [Massilia sp. DD77]|uniref:type VI secretion system protein TssA n=1 Tax=Massilia sp. DD77 TaxID=3109349 RepID=UPI002FFE4E96